MIIMIQRLSGISISIL